MTQLQGKLYVIAAPSGAGKTSLVNALVQTMQNLTVSVSHTTRPSREGEVEGINYHFVSKATFEKMVITDDFLEHATIFDHWYGTARSYVTEKLNAGVDVILEIDWQGHQQVKQTFPNAMGIFILPPSFKSLEQRLTLRNKDSAAIMTKRLEDAKTTLSHIHEFDFIVINDDFEHALADLTTIIHGGRLEKRYQLAKYGALLKAF